MLQELKSSFKNLYQFIGAESIVECVHRKTSRELSIAEVPGNGSEQRQKWRFLVFPVR